MSARFGSVLNTVFKGAGPGSVSLSEATRPGRRLLLSPMIRENPPAAGPPKQSAADGIEPEKRAFRGPVAFRGDR